MAAKLPRWWTDPYPEITSSKTAADYLDALGAALKREKQDGQWRLSTGEQELILADHPSELDSFILGFALSHLICERHGLIGRRPGPSSTAVAASPESAEASAQGAPAPGDPAAPAAEGGGD